MARGGARNRSGPSKDLTSARSDKIKYLLTALPAAGFGGPAPAFPLPQRSVYRWEYEDKRKYRVFDEEATEEVSSREVDLWTWAWSQPQACAWSTAEWRWPVVAMWVRTFIICEGPDATAADKGALHRFADQIGMTPAGLKENGWAIAEHVDVAAPAPTPPTPGRRKAPAKTGTDPRRRFKVVS